MTYVLFDIGGTKTRVAISHDCKAIAAVKHFKTPADFADGVEKLTDLMTTLLAGKKPQGIAGGIRGLLNEEKTGIENDSALEAWAGKSLQKEVAKHFKAPFFLENDAAIAGVGEAVFGAGRGLDIVAYHTVSTGVGGVKVEKGDIDHASIGFEPGHQILDIDRTILGEDITPTLENLVSGTAVEQRFGVKPYEIPQSDVLWEEFAEYLGQGLRNTILYWSPDAIVLGGSMITGDPRIEIDAIRKYTVAALDGFVPCPLIVEAKLGDEAGLYGGMAILERRLAH
jgi:predicted NBD/HSP70 family sugar kinase